MRNCLKRWNYLEMGRSYNLWENRKVPHGPLWCLTSMYVSMLACLYVSMLAETHEDRHCGGFLFSVTIYHHHF